jgi:hypothetical protein
VISFLPITIWLMPLSANPALFAVRERQMVARPLSGP